MPSDEMMSRHERERWRRVEAIRDASVIAVVEGGSRN
jgi:hypothetical protein